jgi:hypothetical protein
MSQIILDILFPLVAGIALAALSRCLDLSSLDREDDQP